MEHTPLVLIDGRPSLLPSGDITINAGGVGSGETLSTSLVKTTGNGIVNTGLTITTTVGVSPAITIDADRTLLLIGQNGWLIAACHSKTTGFGAASVLRASGNFEVSGSCAVGKLIDTDKVLVVSVPTSSTAFQSVVLTLVGTTITVGSATSTTLPTAAAYDPFGLQTENLTGIVTIGGTHIIGYSGGRLVAMTVSGTTVTAKASADTVTSGAPHPALLYVNGSNLIVVSTSLSGTEGASAVASCSVSGTTITAGSSVALATGAYTSVVNLGGGRFARVSSTSAGGVTGEIITQSGTTVSKTSVNLMVSTGVTQPVVSVNAISASKIVVASNISGFARINVLTNSSGTAVAGTVLALPTASGGIAGDFGVRNGASVLTMFTTSASIGAVLRVANGGNNPAIVGGSAFLKPTNDGWTGSVAYVGDATSARGQQLIGSTITTHLNSQSLAMTASDSGEGFAIFAPASGILSRQSNSAIWHYCEIGSTRIVFTKVEVS